MRAIASVVHAEHQHFFSERFGPARCTGVQPIVMQQEQEAEDGDHNRAILEDSISRTFAAAVSDRTVV